MSRGERLLLGSCLLLATVVCGGCNRGHDVAEQDIMVSSDQGKTWEPSTKAPRKEGPKPDALTRSQLMSLDLGYSNFCAAYGRAPANVEEFAPLLVATTFPASTRQQEEECLRLLKEGQYAVSWNGEDTLKAADNSYIVTAYETRTAKEGGFVIFADMRVEWMTPEEFAKAIAKDAPKTSSQSESANPSPSGEVRAIP